MSDTNNAQTEGAAPKKRSKKLLFIILLLVLLMGGGGGGFMFWRHRSAQAQAATAKVDTKKEKKSEEDDVKEVIELLPFVVNLADREEPKYLRMTVSLGIGEGTEKPDPLFTTKVRNAILAVVTTKTADQILTVDGKTELRKEMLEAAQTAADKPAIHAIYITDFIVQM
ncbi:MAG TPA: flagellar basal body-associated FliL family protein [Pyrinomonadaceae bacterium]